VERIKSYAWPAILLTGGVAAIIGGVNRRPSPELRPGPVPLPSVHVKVEFTHLEGGEIACPTPGVLDVEAVLGATSHPKISRAHHYSPRLEVARWTGSGWEAIWWQDYDDRIIAVNPGTRERHEFHQELAMPPGHYRVVLKARDLDWTTAEDGRPVLSPAPPGGPGRVAYATVK
jgi:hypothetical protein